MKTKIPRRSFLRGSVAFGASSGFAPLRVLGASRPRLVVIGGGAAGATLARLVAEGGKIDVTLVEPRRRHTTCIFSNHVLGGLRTFQSITHGYEILQSRYEVEVVHEQAVHVDPDARKVRLRSGAGLAYDRLVVAPGVEFQWNSIDGYDEAASQRMPHAYSSGAQLKLLKAGIESVPDGGLVVIAAPPNPYRCPPAPYERASMIAHYFSRHRPDAKILILDAKNQYSKQDLFQQAWARFYPEMIEWLPAEMTDGGVKAVHPSSMEVVTEDETFRADAACIIPSQRAGDIARTAGLTDASGWCPVRPDTLASTLVPDVHVVGDSTIAGDMPKSGYSAVTQARACANAIGTALAGEQRREPRFRNTCWSLVAAKHGIKVGADYVPAANSIKQSGGFVSQLDDTDEDRRSVAEEAETWYAGIVKGMFG